MKTVTYTIPTPSLSATTPEISVQDSFVLNHGHTLFKVKFDNIVEFRQNTLPYIKFIIDYGDGTTEEISNPLGFNTTLSGQRPSIVQHEYESEETIIQNIPITIKGLKTNLLFDTFYVHATIKRPKIKDYGDMELVKTHIFDVDESRYGVLIVAGLDDPNKTGNILLPLTKGLEPHRKPPKPVVFDVNIPTPPPIWRIYDGEEGGWPPPTGKPGWTYDDTSYPPTTGWRPPLDPGCPDCGKIDPEILENLRGCEYYPVNWTAPVFNITPPTYVKLTFLEEVSHDVSPFELFVKDETPVQPSTFMNTWARFFGHNFYEVGDLPAGNAVDDWYFSSTPSDTFIQPNNTSQNGFVSNTFDRKWGIDTIIYSSNSDDDSNGIVAAFKHVGGANKSLIFDVNHGGTPPNLGWGLNYNYGNALINLAPPYGPGNKSTAGWPGGYGWSSNSGAHSTIRVRVERQDHIITAWCSDWADSTKILIGDHPLNSQSEIKVNLETGEIYTIATGQWTTHANAASIAADFGAQGENLRYGLFNYSQGDSRFLDIKVTKWEIAGGSSHSYQPVLHEDISLSGTYAYQPVFAQPVGIAWGLSPPCVNTLVGYEDKLLLTQTSTAVNTLQHFVLGGVTDFPVGDYKIVYKQGAYSWTDTTWQTGLPLLSGYVSNSYQGGVDTCSYSVQTQFWWCDALSGNNYTSSLSGGWGISHDDPHHDELSLFLAQQEYETWLPKGAYWISNPTNFAQKISLSWIDASPHQHHLLNYPSWFTKGSITEYGAFPALKEVWSSYNKSHPYVIDSDVTNFNYWYWGPSYGSKYKGKSQDITKNLFYDSHASLQLGTSDFTIDFWAMIGPKSPRSSSGMLGSGGLSPDEYEDGFFYFGPNPTWPQLSQSSPGVSMSLFNGPGRSTIHFGESCTSFPSTAGCSTPEGSSARFDRGDLKETVVTRDITPPITNPITAEIKHLWLSRDDCSVAVTGNDPTTGLPKASLYGLGKIIFDDPTDFRPEETAGAGQPFFPGNKSAMTVTGITLATSSSHAYAVHEMNKTRVYFYCNDGTVQTRDWQTCGGPSEFDAGTMGSTVTNAGHTDNGGLKGNGVYTSSGSKSRVTPTPAFVGSSNGTYPIGSTGWVQNPPAHHFHTNYLHGDDPGPTCAGSGIAGAAYNNIRAGIDTWTGSFIAGVTAIAFGDISGPDYTGSTGEVNGGPVAGGGYVMTPSGYIPPVNLKMLRPGLYDLTSEIGTCTSPTGYNGNGFCFCLGCTRVGYSGSSQCGPYSCGNAEPGNHSSFTPWGIPFPTIQTSVLGTKCAHAFGGEGQTPTITPMWDSHSYCFCNNASWFKEPPPWVKTCSDYSGKIELYNDTTSQWDEIVNKTYNWNDNQSPQFGVGSQYPYNTGAFPTNRFTSYPIEGPQEFASHEFINSYTLPGNATYSKVRLTGTNAKWRHRMYCNSNILTYRHYTTCCSFVDVSSPCKDALATIQFTTPVTSKLIYGSTVAGDPTWEIDWYPNDSDRQKHKAKSHAFPPYTTWHQDNDEKGLWHHFAISRQNLNTKIFVDGNVVGTIAGDNTNYSADSIVIGTSYIRENYSTFKGYLDSFRVTKAARYTTNFNPRQSFCVRQDGPYGDKWYYTYKSIATAEAIAGGYSTRFLHCGGKISFAHTDQYPASATVTLGNNPPVFELWGLDMPQYKTLFCTENWNMSSKYRFYPDSMVSRTNSLCGEYTYQTSDNVDSTYTISGDHYSELEASDVLTTVSGESGLATEEADIITSISGAHFEETFDQRSPYGLLITHLEQELSTQTYTLSGTHLEQELGTQTNIISGGRNIPTETVDTILSISGEPLFTIEEAESNISLSARHLEQDSSTQTYTLSGTHLEEKFDQTYTLSGTHLEQELSTQAYTLSGTHLEQELGAQTNTISGTHLEEKFDQIYTLSGTHLEQELGMQTYVLSGTHLEQELGMQTYVLSGTHLEQELGTQTYVLSGTYLEQELGTQTYVLSGTYLEQELGTQTNTLSGTYLELELGNTQIPPATGWHRFYFSVVLDPPFGGGWHYEEDVAAALPAISGTHLEEKFEQTNTLSGTYLQQELGTQTNTLSGTHLEEKFEQTNTLSGTYLEEKFEQTNTLSGTHLEEKFEQTNTLSGTHLEEKFDQIYTLSGTHLEEKFEQTNTLSGTYLEQDLGTQTYTLSGTHSIPDADFSAVDYWLGGSLPPVANWIRTSSFIPWDPSSYGHENSYYHYMAPVFVDYVKFESVKIAGVIWPLAHSHGLPVGQPMTIALEAQDATGSWDIIWSVQLAPYATHTFNTNFTITGINKTIKGFRWQSYPHQGMTFHGMKYTKIVFPTGPGITSNTPYNATEHRTRSETGSNPSNLSGHHLPMELGISRSSASGRYLPIELVQSRSSSLSSGLHSMKEIVAAGSSAFAEGEYNVSTFIESWDTSSNSLSGGKYEIQHIASHSVTLSGGRYNPSAFIEGVGVNSNSLSGGHHKQHESANQLAKLSGGHYNQQAIASYGATLTGGKYHPSAFIEGVGTNSNALTGGHHIFQEATTYSVTLSGGVYIDRSKESWGFNTPSTLSGGTFGYGHFTPYTTQSTILTASEYGVGMGFNQQFIGFDGWYIDRVNWSWVTFNQTVSGNQRGTNITVEYTDQTTEALSGESKKSKLQKTVALSLSALSGDQQPGQLKEDAKVEFSLSGEDISGDIVPVSADIGHDLAAPCFKIFGGWSNTVLHTMPLTSTTDVQYFDPSLEDADISDYWMGFYTVSYLSGGWETNHTSVSARHGYTGDDDPTIYGIDATVLWEIRNHRLSGTWGFAQDDPYYNDTGLLMRFSSPGTEVRQGIPTYEYGSDPVTSPWGDDSKYNHTMVVHEAVSNDISLWVSNTGSAHFTADQLNIYSPSSSAFNISANGDDYTVDCWVNFKSANKIHGLLQQPTSGLSIVAEVSSTQSTHTIRPGFSDGSLSTEVYEESWLIPTSGVTGVSYSGNGTVENTPLLRHSSDLPGGGSWTTWTSPSFTPLSANRMNFALPCGSSAHGYPVPCIYGKFGSVNWLGNVVTGSIEVFDLNENDWVEVYRFSTTNNYTSINAYKFSGRQVNFFTSTTSPTAADCSTVYYDKWRFSTWGDGMFGDWGGCYCCWNSQTNEYDYCTGAVSHYETQDTTLSLYLRDYDTKQLILVDTIHNNICGDNFYLNDLGGETLSGITTDGILLTAWSLDTPRHLQNFTGDEYTLHHEPQSRVIVSENTELPTQASWGDYDFQTDTWYHIAAVREDFNTRLYVNGNLINNTYNYDSTQYSSSFVEIGGCPGPGGDYSKSLYQLQDGPWHLHGNLDNIRFTTAARFSSNFTPPNLGRDPSTGTYMYPSPAAATSINTWDNTHTGRVHKPDVMIPGFDRQRSGKSDAITFFRRYGDIGIDPRGMFPGTATVTPSSAPTYQLTYHNKDIWVYDHCEDIYDLSSENDQVSAFETISTNQSVSGSLVDISVPVSASQLVWPPPLQRKVVLATVTFDEDYPFMGACVGTLLQDPTITTFDNEKAPFSMDFTEDCCPESTGFVTSCTGSSVVNSWGDGYTILHKNTGVKYFSTWSVASGGTYVFENEMGAWRPTQQSDTYQVQASMYVNNILVDYQNGPGAYLVYSDFSLSAFNISPGDDIEVKVIVAGSQWMDSYPSLFIRNTTLTVCATGTALAGTICNCLNIPKLRGGGDPSLVDIMTSPGSMADSNIYLASPLVVCHQIRDAELLSIREICPEQWDSTQNIFTYNCSVTGGTEIPLFSGEEAQFPVRQVELARHEPPQDEYIKYWTADRAYMPWPFYTLTVSGGRWYLPHPLTVDSSAIRADMIGPLSAGDQNTAPSIY